MAVINIWAKRKRLTKTSDAQHPLDRSARKQLFNEGRAMGEQMAKRGYGRFNTMMPFLC